MQTGSQGRFDNPQTCVSLRFQYGNSIPYPQCEKQTVPSPLRFFPYSAVPCRGKAVRKTAEGSTERIEHSLSSAPYSFRAQSAGFPTQKGRASGFPDALPVILCIQSQSLFRLPEYELIFICAMRPALCVCGAARQRLPSGRKQTSGTACSVQSDPFRHRSVQHRSLPALASGSARLSV